MVREVAAHVAQQITPAALRKAFADRAGDGKGQTLLDTEKARQRATARRDRLIAAVESGALTLDEATPRLNAIRAELAALTPSDAPLPVPAHPESIHSRVERLVVHAREMVALAESATGAELRELLRPWVDGLTFEKESRALTLRLRTVASRLTARDDVAGGSP